MEKYEFFTVNVFSDRGIYGGNQLGIVLDANKLTTDEMQAIAKQFNYSESTFITSQTDIGASVKIFLPNREIAFAGHPTIGSAFILEKLWREKNPMRDKITLNLKLGDIDISVNKELHCIMDQFPPKFKGEFDDREYIAELLGIEIKDMLNIPIQSIAPSDLPFLFVGVKTSSIMKKIKPDFQRLIDEFDQINGEPYVFTMQTDDGGDVRGRLFAPKSGINEDPATGSAQASLALALVKGGLIEHPENGSVKIITEQGYEMGRPSKMYNELLFVDNRLANTKTGGNTSLISHGLLYI